MSGRSVNLTTLFLGRLRPPEIVLFMSFQYYIRSPENCHILFPPVAIFSCPSCSGKVNPLPLSSHLFFCLFLLYDLFTVLCKIVSAKPEDLEIRRDPLCFILLTGVRGQEFVLLFTFCECVGPWIQVMIEEQCGLVGCIKSRYKVYHFPYFRHLQLAESKIYVKICWHCSHLLLNDNGMNFVKFCSSALFYDSGLAGKIRHSVEFLFSYMSLVKSETYETYVILSRPCCRFLAIVCQIFWFSFVLH